MTIEDTKGRFDSAMAYIEAQKKRGEERPNIPYFLMSGRGGGKTLAMAEDLMKRMINQKYGIQFAEEEKNMYIKNVIFNEPATIVMWNDGTKTVVKAQNELFDPEKGLAMAIVKKLFRNQGNYYNEIKKWLPKEEDD